MLKQLFICVLAMLMAATPALAGLTGDDADALKEGAAKNDKKAVAALRKAAEAGDAVGQFSYGVLFGFGYGVKKNEAEAVMWYRKAAEQGHAAAQYNLGVMLANETEAVMWYRKAAEQGHAGAQYNLGVMLANGQGVTKNEAEAVMWYRKAAEQGGADAQNTLGWMLENGLGVVKNETEAVMWYRKAAEQGDASAQCNLGVMLANGQGVTKNEAEAVMWYRKAAEQGDASAQFNLGQMLRQGQGVAKDETEAVAWYRKAAEQGHADAQNTLGWMLENGLGVVKNETEALDWYKKATAGGNDLAKNNYANLDKRLNCARSAITRLFDTAVVCSNRKDFRVVLKQAGLRATREDDRYWYDNYDSSSVLEKSSKLEVGYARAGDLAVAEYEFPSHMDAGLVVWVRKMVESKYGEPNERQGNPGLGEVTYRWWLKDGVEVKVWRGWPITTTYLSYTVPRYKRVLDDEIEANKREQEAEKFRKQGNAF